MNEMSDQIVQRFQRIYIGDSYIKSLVLDFEKMQCTFLLNGGSLMKDSPNPSIFDPEQTFEPAVLVFYEVHSFACPEGAFYLNSTIVGFKAQLDRNSDLVMFHLEMSGGFDNESFMRSLSIQARNFSLGS
jgi:hypothetical protein